MSNGVKLKFSKLIRTYLIKLYARSNGKTFSQDYQWIKQLG